MKLDPNHIDLWTVDADNFKLRDLLMLSGSWLSSAEEARLNRFRLERSKHEFLVGRYMLRSVLSLYARFSPQDWVFDYNEYGKPSISKAQQNEMEMPLYFNLSHSRGKLIMAVSRYEQVGVDIEYGLKPRRIEKIANRYFSASEVEGLEGLPDHAKQTRFYDLWSLKEAYIKACGLGLAIPLGDFSYRFSSAGAIVIEFDAEREDVPEAWQFWQIGSILGFHIAIAIKSAHAEHLHIAKFFQLKPLGELKTVPLIVARESFPS